MAAKLYVGNLSFNTSESDLQQMFEKVGSVVSSTIIMDKMTGQSRGFGFVEMSSQDEANKAIAEFNGKDLDGRSLTVNEAKPREERSGGGGGGGYGRGGGGYGRGRR